MKLSCCKFNLILFCLALLFAFSGIISCSAEEKASPYPPPIPKSVTIIKSDKDISDKYKILPGDVISVSVYNEPDFSQPEIVVRPDGYATIDPIGEILVEGLDVENLTQILENKFLSYLNDPVISLNVKEFYPVSVYIFGAVEKPGTFQQVTQISENYSDSKNPTVRTELSLANVIANMGGLSNDADLSNVTVTSSDKKTKKIDLWKFIRNGDVTQNIKLKSGDIIFVPKLASMRINDDDFKSLCKMSLFPETFPVQIVGEVNTAGNYNISGNSPYLNTAIAEAAGYTLDANKSAVVVYRESSNEKLAKIYVNPFKQNFVLRPNDLIEVKKRKLMKTTSGADYLVRLISPVLNIGSSYNSWADAVNPTRRFLRFYY